MVDFPSAVSAPTGVSYAAPLIDFSPISKLADRFYEGAKNRVDYDTAQALREGVPLTADGEIDYPKLTQRLAQAGNLAGVTGVAKIDALRQKTDTNATMTSDIKEFQFAQGQGFKGTFEDWMQRKRGGAGEYGLQPVWGRDKDGNPVMLQAGKSGTAIQTKLPEGVTLSGKNAEKLDAGTHWVLIDPLTRQQVGLIPKDLQGKEAAEERGKAQGQAQVALNTAATKAAQAERLIDEMLNHPGRETATGKSGVFDPRNYIPGTDAKDFQVRSKQLQGTVFLEAFQSLRGGGAITEVEGQKAEAAIARLDRAQSDEEYVKALRELKGIIRTGLINARKRASGRFNEEAGGEQPAPSGKAAPQSAADPLADARAAIAKGADRQAVIDRLTKNGIDATGL